MKWSALLLLAGCAKDPTPSLPPPVPPASVSPIMSATASATASAIAPEAPKATASSTSTLTKATASAKPPALKGARAHVDGKNFALDVASVGCRVDAECVVTIKLAAQTEYHVNKEYPYKFVAEPAPNLAFLGKSNAATFSKADGDFTEHDAKSATMSVRFKPSAAGDAKVSGEYRFSVCSDAQCQIEKQPIVLSISVM